MKVLGLYIKRTMRTVILHGINVLRLLWSFDTNKITILHIINILCNSNNISVILSCEILTYEVTIIITGINLKNAK